jgi:hypothetical protein
MLGKDPGGSVPAIEFWEHQPISRQHQTGRTLIVASANPNVTQTALPSQPRLAIISRTVVEFTAISSPAMTGTLPAA